jgi:ribosomal protein S11
LPFVKKLNKNSIIATAVFAIHACYTKTLIKAASMERNTTSKEEY